MKSSLIVMFVFLLSASVAVAEEQEFSLLFPEYKLDMPFLDVYYSVDTHPAWFTNPSYPSPEEGRSASIRLFLDAVSLAGNLTWNSDPWIDMKFIPRGTTTLGCNEPTERIVVIICWTDDIRLLNGGGMSMDRSVFGPRIYVNLYAYEYLWQRISEEEMLTVLISSIAHEEGHVLGLDHVPSIQSIMSTNRNQYAEEIIWSDSDKKGARYMHPFPSECAARVVYEEGVGVVLHLDNVEYQGAIYDAQLLYRAEDTSFVPIWVTLDQAQGILNHCTERPLFADTENMTLSVPVITNVLDGYMREYSLHLQIRTTPLTFLIEGYEPK